MPSPLRVERAEVPATVKEQVRLLTRPDPRGFLTQWLLAWLSVIAAIAIAVRLGNPVVTAVAVCFVATRQNLLALLMHEQTHWLGFRSKWGDYFCELFVAYPLMITLEGYRRLHLTHHSYYFTDDDPDYLRKQGKEWTFPQQMGFFLLVVLRDLAGISAVKTLRAKSLNECAAKVKTRFYPPRWLRPAFLVVLATTLTLTHTWTMFLLFWMLPLLTVLQGIVRLGAITEHKYNLIDPSVEESTPLIELLWWEKILLPNLNFTLHIYHHWYPTVPASKLPVVHRIFREAGLVNEPHVFHGYAAYLRYLLRPASGRKERTMTAGASSVF